MRLLLCLTAIALSGCAQAWAGDFVIGNPQDGGGCFVAGDDGGSTARVAIPGGNQFMVSASSSVTYRTCQTSNCTAGKLDAPIASGAQVDLCMPSAYSTASFYVASGTSTVCVYLVKPKTVCQVNSP